jgi:hypothetical protein
MKKTQDLDWLQHYRKDLTCAQIDNFVERVGIKVDSDMPEEQARQEAFVEIFSHSAIIRP